MSDKHLERKEILNLVYTRQADRMADAYARLMADFSQMTAWGRGLESDLSCARSELMQVNADVELWKLRSDNWQKFCQLTRPEMTDELNRLKAEVERLSKKEDYHHDLLNQYALDDMRLQAEVERLTKAVDAMKEEIEVFYREKFLYPNDSYSIQAWNAAKEGKQP